MREPRGTEALEHLVGQCPGVAEQEARDEGSFGGRQYERAPQDGATNGVRRSHRQRGRVIEVDELVRIEAGDGMTPAVAEVEAVERPYTLDEIRFSQRLREKVRRLKHLDQRITIRYHLNTLDYAHSSAYVAHRLKMAGRTTPIFTDEAVRLIFDFTRGTPREINNLCDVALLVGYTKRATKVDEKIVAEVIKDMVGVS